MCSLPDTHRTKKKKKKKYVLSLRHAQDYAILKLGSYASRSKEGLKSVSDAVRDELSARYARSAQALAEDLTPLMQLLDDEMTTLSTQLSTVRRQLHRFYRRNPYMQEMGTAVTERFLAVQ